MFKYTFFVFVFLIISCEKQNEVNKQNSCLISNIYNIQTDKLAFTFKYDSKKRLVEYTAFNINCAYIYKFDYAVPNQINLSYLGDCLPQIADLYPGTIFLDKDGNASKISTNEKNANINVKYENGKLKSHTTVRTPDNTINSTTALNFEYIGNNISKVLMTYEDKVSTLKYDYTAYETKKFDDRPNWYPKEFKFLILYGLSNFSGLSFESCNENICLDQTVSQGQFGNSFKTLTFYEYDSNGNPLKSGLSYFNNGVLQFGDSETFRHRYEFVCE